MDSARRNSASQTVARKEEALLRVANSTATIDLAKSIVEALYETDRVKLRAIGAGAVNQAAKACAIARDLMAHRGVDLVVRISFETVKSAKPGEGEISAVAMTASPA